MEPGSRRLRRPVRGGVKTRPLRGGRAHGNALRMVRGLLDGVTLGLEHRAGDLALEHYLVQPLVLGRSVVQRPQILLYLQQFTRQNHEYQCNNSK